jgi:hypothetical protein
MLSTGKFLTYVTMKTIHVFAEYPGGHTSTGYLQSTYPLHTRTSHTRFHVHPYCFHLHTPLHSSYMYVSLSPIYITAYVIHHTSLHCYLYHIPYHTISYHLIIPPLLQAGEWQPPAYPSPSHDNMITLYALALIQTHCKPNPQTPLLISNNTMFWEYIYSAQLFFTADLTSMQPKEALCSYACICTGGMEPFDTLMVFITDSGRHRRTQTVDHKLSPRRHIDIYRQAFRGYMQIVSDMQKNRAEYAHEHSMKVTWALSA